MKIVESVIVKMFVFATCVVVFTACTSTGGTYEGTARRPQATGFNRP